MSTNDAIDYAALRDKSQQDVTDMLKSGELALPPKGAQRDEFEKFVAGTPEERDAFIAGQSPEPSSQPSEEPGGEPPAPAAAPEPSAAGTPPSPSPAAPEPSAPASPEPSEKKPWWEEDGYASEEEAVQKFRKAREHNQRLTDQLDERNGTNGQLGRENKELRSKLAEFEQNQQPAAPAPGTQQPPSAIEIPKPPSPADFGLEADDVDDYQKALAEHNTKLTETLAALSQRYDTQAAELKSVKDGVAQHDQYFTTSKQETAKQQQAKAWGDMWDNVRTFQKDYGLSTSKDIAEINAAVLKKDKAYLDALPEQDMQAFDKVAKAVGAAYDFGEEGTPRAKYRTIHGALVDNGLADDYTVAVPASQSAEERNQANQGKQQQIDTTVSVPPADNVAGTEDDLGSGAEMSDEDAQLELARLDKLRSANPLAFQKDKDAYEKYVKLRKRFGLKAPRAVGAR